MSAAGLVRAQVAAMVEAAFDEGRHDCVDWPESQARIDLHAWLAADAFTAAPLIAATPPQPWERHARPGAADDDETNPHTTPARDCQGMP